MLSVLRLHSLEAGADIASHLHALDAERERAAEADAGSV